VLGLSVAYEVVDSCLPPPYYANLTNYDMRPTHSVPEGE
jgi:hypothetical protein